MRSSQFRLRFSKYAYYRHEREFLDLISAEQWGHAGSISDFRRYACLTLTVYQTRWTKRRLTRLGNRLEQCLLWGNMSMKNVLEHVLIFTFFEPEYQSITWVLLLEWSCCTVNSGADR